jgi:hypothetical protein
MKKHKNAIFFLAFACIFFCNLSPIFAQKKKDFKTIFNGKNLKGWAGDTQYWRVENGCIIGEITPETILKTNSFLVYQGGELADFEFKAQFKITEKGNSGVNYRSVIYPDVPHALKGYQADIDGAIRYTGQNYEERGRTTLAYRGQITTIKAQTNPMNTEQVRAKVQKNAWTDLEVTGSLGENEFLKEKIKAEDWNDLHLIIKGNRLQHFVNGVLMSDVTDLDSVNGKSKGLLGMQVHVGPPMKVQYRDIKIKIL